MSLIDYYISTQSLDTRLPIANQFMDVTDIYAVDLVSFQRIKFSNDVASGYVYGEIELISSKAVAGYHKPILNGDRLTVWTENEEDPGWTRETFRVESIDRYIVFNNAQDYRVFGFDDVSLSDFLATDDLRTLTDLNSANTIFGGDESDFISAGRRADFVSGESGQDTIRGGGGDDNMLRGGGGDDKIFGGRGDDFIFGEDRTGAPGRDTLTGGAGEDTFVYTSAIEGGDVIVDFSSLDDTLRFDTYPFLNLGSDFDLIVGVNPTATDDVATFLFDRRSHMLSWDRDGSGSEAAVEIATLEDVAKLTRADFEFV